MTKNEFNTMQLKKLAELAYENPVTELEKDIWNLKRIRYGIMFGSFDYRHGFIKTLDRAIARLEAENGGNAK